MQYFYFAFAAVTFLAINFTFSWIQANRIQARARANFTEQLQTLEKQYVAAIAAQMAAPHLSPDPRHAEENRLILDHWVHFTRKMFQTGTLPS